MERERSVGLVYDDRMCKHYDLTDETHVEGPKRITSIMKCLESEGIVEKCVEVEARFAKIAELESVHGKDHIAQMRIMSDESQAGRRNSDRDRYEKTDVYFNKQSYESACLAAGSVVEISLRVARGKHRAGAAVVRPPGHHAGHDEAMGFCLFNNVAIAAHVLVHGNLPDTNVGRVLIVDWDVHHGNGTQAMFWTDPKVLYFSIHRKDIFPGQDGRSKLRDCNQVGEGSGAGFNINVPWPTRGFGDADYLAAFDEILLPVAKQFKPDIVLVSAGFDAAKGDSMGECNVTPAGYSQMTHKLMDLAEGRLVLVLEGGYDIPSLCNSYLACMKVMLGNPPQEQIVSNKRHNSTSDLLRQVRQELQKYWPVLSIKDVKADPEIEVIVLSDSAEDDSPVLSIKDVKADPEIEVIGLSDSAEDDSGQEDIMITTWRLLKRQQYVSQCKPTDK